MADTLKNKLKLYWKSKISTINIGANAALETSLANLGMLPPSGYSILSMNYVVTGSGTVAESEAHWQGLGGQTDATNWALVLKNVGSSSRTWTLRIIVWYVKDEIIQELT